MKVLKETFMSEESEKLNLLQYVTDFRTRLTRACDIARDNLKSSQLAMKDRYDRKTKERTFEPGDQVLALLPIPGKNLQARYFGPYRVEKKVSDLNYVLITPDRRKEKQLCHINMLKPYIERGSNKVVNVITSDLTNNERDFCVEFDQPAVTGMLHNSEVLHNLDSKVSHLPPSHQEELKLLLHRYEHLFPDIPSRTDKVYHDVDVGDSQPVKQHPYRLNPIKEQYLQKEIQFLLQHDFIEPSKSPWSSPCILIPKADGSYRMCTDYRKVNILTKSDTFPIPRVDDCIDKIGNATFVTKFDLLKGFWQVPLTERAKEISAFVTPNGLYQYKVMPFGMKNSPATFQRMINSVTSGLSDCEAYIDDVILHSDSWDSHLGSISAFFERLSDAKLTVNLTKSEFGCAQVIYLGHVVGQGQVKPVNVKVSAISEYPKPECKRQLLRFLGMVGYYRKFCPNFSTISEPLTCLLKKNVPFVWTESCQTAFEKLKVILESSPVLSAPDFSAQFKLATDASDVAAGAVLLQEGKDCIDHPICYFSRKFDKSQRNYSTIEKECLSLILALHHFEVYITSSHQTVVVYCDHNPLVFIHKMSNKNQRLLRWSLILQKYDLDIRHIKGKDNIVADCLSRI